MAAFDQLWELEPELDQERPPELDLELDSEEILLSASKWRWFIYFSCIYIIFLDRQEGSYDNLICVLKVKDLYCYQIPSFSVLSVSLRHAVVQMHKSDDTLELCDVFFKEDKSLMVPTPVCLEPLQTCYVDVSIYNTMYMWPSMRKVTTWRNIKLFSMV